MVPDIVQKMHGVTLLVGFPGHEPILEVVAELARVGSVQMVCCGGDVDRMMLTRIVQRHTAVADPVLARIKTVRPLSTTQTLNAIAVLTPRCPVVLFDLLIPFLGKNEEALLRRATARLGELGRETAVFITTQPPPSAGQMPLLHQLQDIATRVYVYRIAK